MESERDELEAWDYVLDLSEDEEDGETDRVDGNSVYEEGGEGSCGDDKDEDNEDGEEEENHSAWRGGAQQFERVDYEALAERKRKAITDCNGGDRGKKVRQEDMFGASLEEIMELKTFGLRKRKSREPKKRGRRKGSKNRRNPDITRLLGEATLLYVKTKYEEAIPILNKVIMIAPEVPEAYHTFGLIHEALGHTEKAIKFYTLAAYYTPKDSSLWKLLYSWHMSRGDKARARKCLSKAVTADPSDITLRVCLALLDEECKDYQKAADSYKHIVQNVPDSPDIVEVLMKAAELYFRCDQIEQSVNILEEYLKGHPSEVDVVVVNLLAAMFMATNAHSKALQCIQDARLNCSSGKELPPQLKVKAGICHLYLGDIEKAESEFGVLQQESVSDHTGLIIEAADAFMDLQNFDLALKYYHILESNVATDIDGSIRFKIAHCYLSLEDKVKAATYFHKALGILEDNVEARLALATLMLEDAKEDEAISLLSPPQDSDLMHWSSDKKKHWWFDSRVKLKLCHIYRAKGMLEEFVNIMFPLVRESLYVKTFRPKVKKRLSMSVLRERAKILDVGATGDIFGGVRPLAPRPDLLKANRARKLLQKKEEQKSADFDWKSKESDDESSQEEVRVPPLPNFLENQEDLDLIIDLCKALQLTKRYWEALETIDLAKRFVCKDLSSAKEELQSLAAQISYNTTDPKHGFECIKSIVSQRPYSFAAWNNYYKITLRLGKSYSRHAKFLQHMRKKYPDCLPPVIISGHQFTMISHHQDAAREYLEAYKLLPESPLINLCVGTALINLALGFRLQNKHQCVAQGLAFLYNNLRLVGNSQEAMYNIARAYHHIGLVTLAAAYYEKVLAIRVEDYPIPKLLNENSGIQEHLEAGYCDLRREAAYNLHLIYKTSGASDLAKQVLKDHCSF